MSCATKDLKKNLVVNCDVPLIKGINEQIYTGRLRDVDSVTYDGTNKKIITNIVLLTGKKLKRWIGQNYSNQVTTGFAANEYGNNIVHGLRYILFSDAADDETELDDIAQINDMFSIVRKNGKNGAFKVYGWETGLRMTNNSSDSNDDTLKGAYVMEFQAPDEKKYPYTFKHTITGPPIVDDSASVLDTLALTLVTS